MIEKTEAKALIDLRPENSRCVFPYLVGEDINNDLNQAPARFVICFENWSLERAENYPELLRIIRERVKPEREKAKDRQGREYWWLFYRWRRDLREAIQDLSKVLVRSRVSELHMIVFEPNSMVFSDATVIFAFDDYFHFALLQSNLHEAWVWKNSSSGNCTSKVWQKSGKQESGKEANSSGSPLATFWRRRLELGKTLLSPVSALRSN